MSANYQVYVLRSNDEGREYVGMSQDANARWLQHQAAARSKTDKPLYVSLRKFGAENFSFTVVGNHSSRNDAKKHERELISQLIDSGQKPYNLQSYRASLCVEDSAPSDKSFRRTNKMQISLTESEKQEIERKAHSMGMPVAVWTRFVIMNETRRIKGAA